MKKRIISFLLTGVLGLSLISCGNTNKEVNTNEKVKVSFWSYFSGTEKAALEEMVEQFNDSQEKVEVIHQYIPFADLKKQLSVGIAAGNLPDIAAIDNPDHAAYAAMGMFEDITDRVKEWGQEDQFFEGPFNSVTYNDKIYGLPFTSNCLALFYNKKMIKDVGLEAPSNWDELKEVATKLSKDGVYGLGIVANKSEEGVFHLLPWLLSAGADIEKIDSQEAIKALDYLKDLMNTGIISKEAINMGPSDLLKQFTTGKLAMMVNGPWMMPSIKEAGVDFEWGVVKIPMDKKYASVLGGENIGVVKGKNSEYAWEFVKFVSEKDNMQNFISKTGYFPPRKDVAEDKVWTSDPIKSVFLEQMEYALPRGPHPKWPEISSAIAVAIQEALTGVKTSEQALKDAQVEIDKVLSK